jgi:hypothetical protein
LNRRNGAITSVMQQINIESLQGGETVATDPVIMQVS